MASVVYSRKRQRELEREAATLHVKGGCRTRHLGLSGHDDVKVANETISTSSATFQEVTPRDIKTQENHISAQSPEPSLSTENAPRKVSWIQLHIDAGQRDISQRTCNTCGMIFTPGAPDDVALHRSYHAKTLARRNRPKELCISSWKNERVVATAATSWVRSISPVFRFGDRVIAIDSTDDLRKIRRLSGIDEYIARQLDGLISEPFDLARRHDLPRFHLKSSIGAGCARKWLALLCIPCDTNEVRGYVLAESVYKADVADLSKDGVVTVRVSDVENSPKYPGESPSGLLCGIRRIWVHPQFRRKGFASVLLNCARLHLAFPLSIPIHRVAFTAPTQSGAKLAAAFLYGEIASSDRNSRKILIYNPE